MRVWFVCASPAFEARVRRMVGGDVNLEEVEAGRAPIEADLIVVSSVSATPQLLTTLRQRAGEAAIMVLPESDSAPALKVQKIPSNLGRMTYRAVLEQLGPHTIPDYLETLLKVHHGNVTKAALAAGVERESLHRLLRRHGVRGHAFRPSETS